MAACVQGNMNSLERQMLDEHLRTCAECTEQVQDLRSFRVSLASAIVPVPIPPPISRSLWTRWSEWTAQHPARLLVWSAPSALAAGLLVLMARPYGDAPNNDLQVAKLRSTLDDTKSRLAQAEQAKEAALEQNQGLLQQQSKLAHDNAELTRSNQAISHLQVDLSHRIAAIQTRLNAAQAQRSPRPGLYQDPKGNWKYRQEVAIASADRAILASSLQNGLRIPSDRLKALQPQNIVTLGHPNQATAAIRLDQPDATLLLSQHPRFAWEPVAGAQRYLLVVTTSEGAGVAKVTLEKHGNGWRATLRTTEDNAEMPLTSDMSMGNAWQAPETAILFHAGEAYAWQVKAYAGAHPEEDPRKKSHFGRFQLVDAAEGAKLQKAQTRYASAPLLLGTLYASEGLVAEAKQQFEKQLVQNPEDLLALRFLRELKQKSALKRPLRTP